MNINVTVIKAFSDGSSRSVSLPYGATCGSLGATVGAPSGAVYRSNGQSADTSTKLGEGDVVIISMGKADAGC